MCVVLRNRKLLYLLKVSRMLSNNSRSWLVSCCGSCHS